MSDPQPVAPRRRSRWYRYGLWSLAALAVLSVLGWIVIEPQIEWSRSWKQGWEHAGLDWDDHKAVLFSGLYDDYSTSSDGSYRFEYNYDPETGLLRPGFGASKAFQAGYNARIQELVKTQGAPSWGMKGRQVTKLHLIAALESRDFREVKAFPFNVTSNIVVTRWHSQMPSKSSSLSIRTPGLLFDYGQPAEHMYVGRLGECPAVWFIRSDSEFVGAFLEDGRYLCSVTINK